MLPRLFLLALYASFGAAEVHRLGLKDCVELALRQNPDILVARLDAEIAAQQVRIHRDPFLPKLYTGSGLAYSSGFPLSVEGSVPSVVRASSVATLINREQRYLLQQAREAAKSAGLDSKVRQDEVVRRLFELYVSAGRAARSAEMARRQADSTGKVFEIVSERVRGGRELPVEEKKARLDQARSLQRAEGLEAEQAMAETLLAALIGLAPGDRLRPVEEDRPAFATPDSEQAAIEAALAASGEVGRLESDIRAKGFQADSARAAKLPRLDLLGEYALLARFNNYEDFFKGFKRHNAQVGVSLLVPLFGGKAADARAAQALAEAERLRLQLSSVRRRIATEVRQAWLDVRNAEGAREILRLELDVARDSLGLLLARHEEGRAGLRDVEQARLLENEKWLQYYDAEHSLDRARIELLGLTGGLLASLR